MIGKLVFDSTHSVAKVPLTLNRPHQACAYHWFK